MGIHTWHRWVAVTSTDTQHVYKVEVFEDTESLEPPEGEGWTLCSAFGVSAVAGAGGSPARPAKRATPKT